MPAMPNLPFLSLRTVRRDWMIRAPLIPMGWPRATAPPCTFTLSLERSIIFRLASTVAAKASLISTASMFFSWVPVCSNKRLNAQYGAMQKSIGSISASEYPRILPRGFRLCLATSSQDMRMMAQAPSLIFEELAAVIAPSLAKAGFRLGSFSFLSFGNSSSSAITYLSMVTGTTSSFSLPALVASATLVYDMMVNSSSCCLVMPASLTVFSAQVPIAILLQTSVSPSWEIESRSF